MKLKDINSVFNMGDTSLRVKRLVDAYRLLLQQLNNLSYSDLNWQNKEFQEEFYKSAFHEITRLEREDGIKIFENFSRKYIQPKAEALGKRARTWTNALVKNGLVNKERTVSEVGSRYLQDKLKPADKLESLFTTDINNLLYFRQYLKQRIYDANSDCYLYSYRFAIKFLLSNDNVPANHFLRIIESIRPTYSESDLKLLISDYEMVKNQTLSFEQYYAKHFNHSIVDAEDISIAKQMFASRNLSSDSFTYCFSNNKSNKTTEVYREFVVNLIDLVDNQNEEAFNKVKSLSSVPAIKKAFGFNRNPFRFSNTDSLGDFFAKNKGNLLIDKDHFNIYQVFIASKRFDLISEYSDLLFRSYQASGIISTHNSLISLNNSWLFEAIIETLDDRFSLSGLDSYEDYENDLQSTWYKDLTLCEIFELSKKDINKILACIQNKFNIPNSSAISEYLSQQKEQEFRSFVAENFPREKVIKILKAISERDDSKVFKLVTENASVPTIFEYILTIAWYHLSEDKDYPLSHSFQVTLDGNKLPLTHRSGGAGDIEIVTSKYSLLIEATLMNLLSQKRAELEPVIRHSVNFKLQQSNRDETYTIFIANEIDPNVLNIFRVLQFVHLNGTNVKGEVDGLNIFALSTKDFIRVLKKEITDHHIISTIKKHRMLTPKIIDNKWYKPILLAILNTKSKRK